MGILYMKNRDGDNGQDVVHQGWNSNTESMEFAISDLMELR